VQYRNRILPLIPLRAVLESGATDHDQTTDPVQVIVFNDGDRSVGVVVDQILDVAEETVTVRQRTGRKGLLGSAVVGKHVADFLDLNQVIRAAAEDWFQSTGGSANGRRILVAEASAFSRGLIRSGLDMVGYRVLEAANLDEAIRGLEQHPVDIVVTALDLPPDGSSALLAAMRRRTEWQRIPILALADSAEQARARAGRTTDFQDCQAKFDREAMLESVARLASTLASSEAVPVCVGEER
jgi:two-component system chemotaxis sensor kinase CheA